jgi:hypothetical protein
MIWLVLLMLMILLIREGRGGVWTWIGVRLMLVGDIIDWIIFILLVIGY